MKKNSKKTMLYLLINTVLLMTLYFLFSEHLQIPYVMIVYLIAGVGLGLYYIIYNRGFVGKNATPDMLPDTMTLAEKQAFLEDSKKRMEKSSWVLALLFPIILTILADVIYLFYLQEFFA